MCTRRTVSWDRLKNAGRDLLNCLPGFGIASGSYCAELNQRPEFGAGRGMSCVVRTSLDLPWSLCPLHKGSLYNNILPIENTSVASCAYLLQNQIELQQVFALFRQDVYSRYAVSRQDLLA